MEWSRQQDAALKAVAAWQKSKYSQVFRLFGYAGTGKTTLAKHIADSTDGNVGFAAYTGKAALVLQQKGCTGAGTIHGLIYKAHDKSRLKLRNLEATLAAMAVTATDYKAVLEMIRVERELLAQPAFRLNEDSDIRDLACLIIDECSMVDGRIGTDVLSFGVPVLVLGDPAQLPPVKGSGFFTNCTNPDVMLMDIHRQAKDNPIISLATDIRNEVMPRAGQYGDSRVIRGGSLEPEDVMSHDQLLVGKNVTRHSYNNRIRHYLERPAGEVVVDDKLVCLRNNHEVGLLNGGLWRVDDVSEMDSDSVLLSLRADSDDSEKVDVEAHTHYFQGRGDDLDWFEAKGKEEFDFGYAMTVHKAQGSQWDKVLVRDESGVFRNNRWRWLYTAVTRAAKSVTIWE